MTTDALTTASGIPPLADLLFSSSTVFVWDASLKAVTWMNGAARARFGCTLAEFTASLSKITLRRLTALSGKAAAPKGPRLVKVKVAKLPVVSCSITPLNISGGHEGLIVFETDLLADKGAQLSPDRSLGRDPVSTPKHEAAAPPPEITPDDLRRFGIIGRRVRKLCREKFEAGGDGRSKPSKVEAARPRLPESAEAHFDPLLALLPAFDLFLVLDHDLRVLKVEGQPQRLGWKKSSLRGAAAMDLFLPSEHGYLDRLVRKAVAVNQTLREHLIAQNPAGDRIPCRAILGRWFEGGPLFLAITSLLLTPRLKRQQGAPVLAHQRSRLAA